MAKEKVTGKPKAGEKPKPAADESKPAVKPTPAPTVDEQPKESSKTGDGIGMGVVWRGSGWAGVPTDSEEYKQAQKDGGTG